ncbi:MAG: response regulator, partial [Kamptonema sp. SIO4C4]|nr:response regulator [Kamptonema sp. SIO4C4]
MVRILVIDDDPPIQLLLKRTLATQDYEVFVASDGVEGLKQAKELIPAMVICDWVMPRMNGIELCRHIKQLPELSTTFFILLTSKKTIDDRVEGLDAGADDFLCKPIDPVELQARVRAGLRLHQLSSDLQHQKQLLEAELAEAAEYVCSILPEPIAHPSVTIDTRFIPSSQLGGDSFDYYWLDEEHLVLYLLDVSGHGLRAALPSLSVINLLRSRALLQV